MSYIPYDVLKRTFQDKGDLYVNAGGCIVNHTSFESLTIKSRKWISMNGGKCLFCKENIKIESPYCLCPTPIYIDMPTQYSLDIDVILKETKNFNNREKYTLTAFVKIKEISNIFKLYIKKPKNIISSIAISANAKTKRYSLIGTAFGFLVSLTLLKEYGALCLNSIEYNNYDKIAKQKASWNTAWGERKKCLSEYVANKREMDLNFFKALITLANLDMYYRSGYPVEDVESFDMLDVEDLKSLFNLIPWEDIKPRKYVLFSPLFSCCDTVISAAEGDLIIDDMLVDIKAIQKMSTSYWYQLIGYYLLYKKNGFTIKKLNNKVVIRKLALYFARHGKLQVSEAEELFVNREGQDSLMGVLIHS